MRRKDTFQVIIVGIIILGFFGCGGRGKSERMVIVYSPHGGDILTQRMSWTGSDRSERTRRAIYGGVRRQPCS
jgi:hypothetical protein